MSCVSGICNSTSHEGACQDRWDVSATKWAPARSQLVHYRQIHNKLEDNLKARMLNGRAPETILQQVTHGALASCKLAAAASYLGGG